MRTGCRIGRQVSKFQTWNCVEGYDPSCLPTVMKKMNDLVDRIAGNVVAFVDDLRASGYIRHEKYVSSGARQIASKL